MSTPVGPVLRVDPELLERTGARFDEAGDALAGLRADAPLSDAAAGVARLATGRACAQTQGDVAATLAALASDALAYGQNLNSAAGRYQAGDQSSAAAIRAAIFAK
jgi:hypothetical protein